MTENLCLINWPNVFQILCRALYQASPVVTYQSPRNSRAPFSLSPKPRIITRPKSPVLMRQLLWSCLIIEPRVILPVVTELQCLVTTEHCVMHPIYMSLSQRRLQNTTLPYHSLQVLLSSTLLHSSQSGLQSPNRVCLVMTYQLSLDCRAPRIDQASVDPPNHAGLQSPVMTDTAVSVSLVSCTNSCFRLNCYGKCDLLMCLPFWRLDQQGLTVPRSRMDLFEKRILASLAMASYAVCVCVHACVFPCTSSAWHYSQLLFRVGPHRLDLIAEQVNGFSDQTTCRGLCNERQHFTDVSVLIRSDRLGQTLLGT